LLFLANVVKRELKHLQATDKRLFSNPLTLATIEQLENDEALSETVEAFVGRFCRLQDTLGDKLLPQLLSYLGERPTVVVDNLDKAERFGWITSTDTWLETRQLRNQMIQQYIEDSNILLNALNTGHEFVSELADVAERMLSEIEMRVVNL
jgi:hypothetical protein